ncbi:MAG: patatin-like phospholipase family protein [Bryobacteraceae bacterium]
MRALVLSGGGMFGAYQAGAWDALSANFRPDIVIGSSVGALHAWLIAGGAPAAEIIRLWRVNPGALRWRLPRSPWDGLVDASAFEARVRSIHEAWRPRIPVGIVTTEWRALRPRLYRDSEIGWRHLASSCAVLGALPQYGLDGRRSSDGGLLGALPLWAAGEAGATSVVAIDLLPRMPFPVPWMLRLLRAVSPSRDWAFSGLVVRIAPQRRLGGLRDAAIWNRDNVERWIAQGRADASAAVFTLAGEPCDAATIMP